MTDDEKPRGYEIGRGRTPAARRFSKAGRAIRAASARSAASSFR
jgi:hypothetical protein